MKIAVMKGGANVTFADQAYTAGNADILYALRTLNPHRNEVTLVTHYTRNTFIPEPLKFKEILDDDLNFDDYDLVLLFNFSLNFFGGAESPSLTQMYRKLSQSSVPIVYVQTDGQLAFKRFWPNVNGRDWAAEYTESEFEINSERITYLTQGRNIARCYQELIDSKHVYVPHKIQHFPWDATILTNHENHFDRPKFELVPFRYYNLAYGGATRNSYRKSLIQYYYCKYKTLKVLLFGNLRDISYNPELVTMSQKVTNRQFIPTMQNAMATIIIGDRFYEDNFFTLRMYESLLAGCIMFITKPMDPKGLFYGDPSNPMYIDSPQHVVDFFNINDDKQRMAWAILCYETMMERRDKHLEENLNQILKGIANVRET